MSTTNLTLEQSSKSFDGYQYIYSHFSWTLDCEMKFGVYVPSLAETKSLPLLIFLSDFSSIGSTLATHCGMQRLAKKFGFIIATPDSNPRPTDENENSIPSFYVDATQMPWSEHYQMFSYINEEFYELMVTNFDVDLDRVGIFGHGMGGHGALISFFKCPAQYRSVSALSPVCHPSKTPLVIEIYEKLFGSGSSIDYEEHWKNNDACCLVNQYDGPGPNRPILIDHGADDSLKDDYRSIEQFLDACANASFPVQYREHHGYDDSHFFLITFLEDHFHYHRHEFDSIDDSTTE